MTQVPTTIFLVDDDESVLRGLTRLLRAAGHATKPFASPAEFLAQLSGDAPGCAVLDLRMPGLNGLELHQAMASKDCHLPVIFISGHGDVPASVRAMKAGAVDFLLKPFDEQQLLGAISQALLKDAAARAGRAETAALQARHAVLTPREREVCALVAQGLTNKEVAQRLGTTEKTIKVHRARVLQKLDVDSVAELVRFVDRLDQG
ncbi:response regulator transcription factor [Pyxidicoccus fallax]|uniref:Response regulator transcription factor n=1 Tax=Pyxidicoccus fallax TaxID=394095 RepID=A0A848LGX6_9BACT|nr:response regulator [Pyxidicoccus fallax]NMO16775.1 response regulator transcription factor [Pyxidicoccus fallax]NPC78385.1 response regulator transcription factor [Pyxidicoccus fallax]